MDTKVKHTLEHISRLSIQTFEESLVGVYVHGSLALGKIPLEKSPKAIIMTVLDMI